MPTPPVTRPRARPAGPRVSPWKRRLRTALARLGFAIGRLRAPRPRVVIASTHTRRLGGNLRFLDEELRAHHPDIPVVRLGLRMDGGGGLLAPILGTLRMGYELAASRAVVIDDYCYPVYVVTPRPGTARVQVWHAAGAFKKFGRSVVDKRFGADADLVENVAIHSNYSVALVSSMAVAPHYAEAFGQPLSIFTSRIGIPRTDLFGDPERRARAEARVRATYPLPAGRRVILYAPTFRGERATEARYAKVLDLATLHAALGEDHVVLLKVHPFVRDRLDIPPELAAFAIDASRDPDVNELMLVSDVLVTDYSSVIYEFALLGRPIAFLAPDDGAYDEERGFYLDFRRDAPGPIVATTEALAAVIRADAFDLDRVRAFATASFDVPPGGACRRLVDEVLRPALAGAEVSGATIEARLAPWARSRGGGGDSTVTGEATTR